jgi:hypothetical protein
VREFNEFDDKIAYYLKSRMAKLCRIKVVVWSLS